MCVFSVETPPAREHSRHFLHADSDMPYLSSLDVDLRNSHLMCSCHIAMADRGRSTSTVQAQLTCQEVHFLLRRCLLFVPHHRRLKTISILSFSSWFSIITCQPLDMHLEGICASNLRTSTGSQHIVGSPSHTVSTKNQHHQVCIQFTSYLLTSAGF